MVGWTCGGWLHFVCVWRHRLSCNYAVKLATEPHHRYYDVVFYFTHHSTYDLMINAAWLFCVCRQLPDVSLLIILYRLSLISPWHTIYPAHGLCHFLCVRIGTSAVSCYWYISEPFTTVQFVWLCLLVIEILQKVLLLVCHMLGAWPWVPAWQQTCWFCCGIRRFVTLTF
jgi:hypothetical protein